MPPRRRQPPAHWPVNNIISHQQYDPRYRMQLGTQFYNARQLAKWILHSPINRETGQRRPATNPLTRATLTPAELKLIRSVATLPGAQIEAAARFYARNNPALVDNRLRARYTRRANQERASKSYRRGHRSMALPYVEARRGAAGNRLTRAEQAKLNNLLRAGY